MKNRKRDIIYLFICTLPVSAIIIYWLISEQDYDMLPWALLPQGFMVICILIMLLQERILKSIADKIKNRPEAELRELVLENFESNSFREITANSMSADLKNLYCRKFAPKNLLLGTVSLVYAYLMAAYIVTGIGNGIMPAFFNIVAGIAALYFGLSGIILVCEAASQFAGFPADRFEKKYREELPMIERSYMGGRMIIALNSVLNIGLDYIVSVSTSECEAVSISDIIGAQAIRVHKVRRDRAGFITKQKFEYVICIYARQRNKPIKHIVNELQAEYIRDELIRRGIK